MDSANSGSIQSSSGGDEEFESRTGSGTVADPILSFFQSNSASNTGTGTLPFYSLSDFASSPLLPFDPTTTSMINNSQTIHPRPSFTLNTSQAQTLTQNITSNLPSSSLGPAGTTANSGPGQQQRSSRKRTRASRRAPTTVLTTDTSNFRAMVQEFTGIPSPPFAPSPMTRSRFDHHLFSTGSSSSLPPYLLRPFAQKLNTGTGTSSVDGGSVQVQGNDQVQVQGQGQGLLNMQNVQNPMLSFQSLLQSQLQAQPGRTIFNFASRTAPQNMNVSNDFVGTGTGTSSLHQGLIGSEGLHQGGGGGWGGTNTGTESNQFNNTVVGTERVASTSCSEFVNVSKEQETAKVVVTRGEGGMVESWLCSSSSDR